MGNLAFVGAASIGIGVLLFMVTISESSDCAFSVERVTLTCADGSNISEKALYVIISVFEIVLGVVLYKTDKRMNG